MTASIHQERHLAHPAAAVWRALTDPLLSARWLMPGDVSTHVGHSFTLETRGWGLTQCVVLAAEAERLFCFSWKNPPLDTVVTWTLTPEDGGTRLQLEHSGFDLDDPQQRMAFDGMGHGWGSMLDDRLPPVLEGLD